MARKQSSLSCCLSLWMVSTGAFIACAPPSVEPPLKPAPVSAKPPARVDLPSLVKLEQKLPPMKHADGDYRVDGLVARRGKFFGQSVKLTAYLVDRVECPKKAKRCTIPHLTIADTPAGEGERLIVVELPEEGLPKVKIGDHLQITGKFDRSSSDGFVRTKGLLVYGEMSKKATLSPKK